MQNISNLNNGQNYKRKYVIFLASILLILFTAVIFVKNNYVFGLNGNLTKSQRDLNPASGLPIVNQQKLPGQNGSVSSNLNSTGSALLGTLLIADRGNNRIIEVNAKKEIVWEYPASTTPQNQKLNGDDDAFLTADKKHIITNEENNQTVKIIDYSTKKIVWEYGHAKKLGSADGFLHTPDDAYQLADGTVTIADIRNCRILFINPDKTIQKQYGKTGICKHNPPATFASPNGDTPLSDGGILISEIGGSYVTRLDKNGKVVFSLRVPLFYPSDAQLTSDGNILVADYHTPGKVIKIAPDGKLLWSYSPTSGPGMLSNPSLALQLPNGNIAVTDDDNQRVVIIDPKTNSIVWQYGHLGKAGIQPGYLSDPDGLDFIPAGRHP